MLPLQGPRYSNRFQSCTALDPRWQTDFQTAVPTRKMARKLGLLCGYVQLVYLEGTTSASREGIVRKMLQETKAKETKMMRTKKAVPTRTTKKAVMKGMKTRVMVDTRRPHIYDPDFCQVMAQPRRRVPLGQRLPNLIPYFQKRTGVLKFQPIAFSKEIRAYLLLSDATNLPFHTLRTHFRVSAKPFIHAPHPSPLLALAPNAS
ncbi:hypothetical protein EI94DRAFT_835491 [Lactarius quietus]|nr:hypothetical protein EI94DRAFT_835491 [Lactarius quietus]